MSPQPGWRGSYWHELEADTGRRILLPAPQLTLGTGLAAVQAAMQAAGAPCELLTEAEAASRFPDVRTDGPALLEPGSAVIDAASALAALAAGVPEIATGVRVTRLTDDGRQVTLRTSAGEITARFAVVTAGPWSGALLGALSVAIHGRATLEQVAYLRPAGQRDPVSAGEPAGPDSAPATDGADGTPVMPATPIFIAHAEQAPYGLPVPGSLLYKVGIHPSGPAISPDAQDQEADPYLVGRLSEVARRYLPGYDSEPAATERCIYDNTPDEDFILDRAGNVVVGCGTSGHGFKFGPLLGRWLADLVSGPGGPRAPGAADPESALDPVLRRRFSLARFRPPVD